MSNPTNAHIGLWLDYSYGVVSGATLTLPIDWGNYLIAALTVLVSWSGISAWQICSFILHQIRAAKTTKDVLDLQTQTLLRDSIGATGTIIEAVKLQWAWKDSRYKTWNRTVPIALVALTVWAAFTAAGILVAEVASKNYQDVVVLAEPYACGFLQVPNDVTEGMTTSIQSKLINDTLAARTYARTFYGGENSVVKMRSTFPMVTLPYSIDTQQDCPFSGRTACLGDNYTIVNEAMAMDTGELDSHVDFGINAPYGDRITFRKRVTCSPIQGGQLISDPVIQTINLTYSGRTGAGEAGNLTFYQVDMGPSGTNNYTFVWSANTPYDYVGYQVEVMPALLHNPSSPWQPDSTFNRTDADVIAILLAQNSVLYYEPVDDPLFFANIPAQEYCTGTDCFPLYHPNYIFNLMACLEQIQFCNPSTNSCTDLTGFYDAVVQLESLDFNPAQQATADRLTSGADLALFYYSVPDFSSSGLLAEDKLFVRYSSALPRNQWQFEVQRWFETSLVKMQGSIADWVSNSWTASQDDLNDHVSVESIDTLTPGPKRDAYSRQCHNQRVLSSAAVQNFSFVGVLLVIFLSVGLIVLGLLLERMVLWLRRWRPSRVGEARQLARDMDSRDHLLRMALEGAGIGGWKVGGFGIPVSSEVTTIPEVVVEDGLGRYIVPISVTSGDIKRKGN